MENSIEKSCKNCRHFVKLYTRLNARFCFCGNGFCAFDSRSKFKKPRLCENWESGEEREADVQTRARLALERIAEEMIQIKSILDE